MLDLQWWWGQEDNAVLFAQFWLADLDPARRMQLTSMEGELLTQELLLAFQTAGNGAELREHQIYATIIVNRSSCRPAPIIRARRWAERR